MLSETFFIILNFLDSEMSGRHRARKDSIQIIKTGRINSNELKRPINTQFINPAIRFPLVNNRPRAKSRAFNKKFASKRPNKMAC